MQASTVIATALIAGVSKIYRSIAHSCSLSASCHRHPLCRCSRRGAPHAVEGQNVAIEYRWAEGHLDRVGALAADLVEHKVEVTRKLRR